MDLKLPMQRSIFGLLLLALFFGSTAVYGQLPNFNLQVVSTNETCTANGSLTFITTDTSPGSILLFRVYKLPDTVTPIAVTNSTSLTGLMAGNYRVVAIQSLGNLSNSRQQDATINNLIEPIVFHVFGNQPGYCGQRGGMTIIADQGNPVSYEIIAGPILFPPQSSNVFTNLLPGQYDIRVNDACGDGLVQTYQLVNPAANLNIDIDEPCPLVDCNTKAVIVNIVPSAGTMVVYPVTMTATFFPPGLDPIVFTETITSGSGYPEAFTYNIPFINTTPYALTVRVTDPCGNISNLNYQLDVTPSLVAQYAVEPDGCTERININVCNMTSPYTVHFTEAPADFNPASFNPLGLGPFTESSFSYVSTHESRLPDGHYAFEVTDACGVTLNTSVDVEKVVTDHILNFVYVGCELLYNIQIPYLGLPVLDIVLQSAPPGYNGPVPVNVSSFIDHLGIFSMNVNALGNYVFTGTNFCSDPFIQEIEVIPPIPELVAGGTMVCLNGKLSIELADGPSLQTVTITQAPAGFPFALPYDASTYIDGNKCELDHLPEGDYEVEVTDICGNSYGPVSANISPEAATPPELFYLRGCGTGMGSMFMKFKDRKFLEVFITAAPPTYTGTLPANVSLNIDEHGNFYMNSLPGGTYTFHTKNICHAQQDVIVEIPGNDVILNTVTINGNCGSFDLVLYHYIEQPYSHSFWLQKLNPETGQWGHPYNDGIYTENTIPNTSNSLLLANYSTNYNIAALGVFRVLKYSQNYSNGVADLADCYTVLKQFEFTGELEILSSGAVPCNNETFDVFITGAGINPLTYLITTKDGLPFELNNGNSNIFSGLDSGTYNFQIQDACGNIINTLLDVATLSEPAIYANDLCDGLSGLLSVQAISFLNYRWWKETAPGTFLSTTNTLSLNPYSEATSPGTYFVHIYSTTNLSCIDLTLSYVVAPAVIPNAGADFNANFCGNATAVDLFTLLPQPFDPGGTWTETTTSGGSLNGSNWSPGDEQFGDFSFRYTVSGSCGREDQSAVSLHYAPIPPEPSITVDSDFCTSSTIQLQAASIPGAAYHWTGPNNFLSDSQNPTVQNSLSIGGVYTVTATTNGCESSSSVTLHPLAIPDFTLVSGCDSGAYSISVRPNNESFDPNTVTYSWTGPSGFTSSENPLPLNGFGPGVYEVTVSNTEGCSATRSLFVPGTLCGIPNVITPNDGDNINQTFDLSGLDVEKLEIYSRWGRLVYEQAGYTNQWYGQNDNNKELPDSTYFYIIYLKLEQPKQGWIYKTAWK